jgi:hypothetical protein
MAARAFPMTACSLLVSPVKFVFIERNAIGCVASYSEEIEYRSGEEKNLSKNEGRIYRLAADGGWRWLDTGKAVRCSEWCDARLFEHEFSQHLGSDDFEVNGS